MDTIERKKKKLKDRKAAILDVSRDLFFKKGYSNVSVQEICEKLSLGKSAVYAIFHSKEEIYAFHKLEALKKLALIYEQTIDPTISNSTSVSFAIEASVRILYDFYLEEEPYYRALFLSSNAELEGVSESTREKILLETQRAKAPMSNVLIKASKSGLIRKIPVESVLRIIYAGTTGIINDFAAHKEENYKKDMLEACLLNAEFISDSLLIKKSKI